MTGFYDAGRNFSVELYKRSWIQRAVMPYDRPASGNPAAEHAIESWRHRNRLKFQSLQREVSNESSKHCG